MRLQSCMEGLISLGVSAQGGMTLADTTASLCLASRQHDGFNPKVGVTPTMLQKMLGTRWSDLSKSVEGGINHFVSVENGGYYAELWSQGENWYAVTGAGIDKSEGGIWLVPGVTKGTVPVEATRLFLKAVGDRQYATASKKSKDCGCN